MIDICHITTVHGPFDDRIFFKQCASLAAEGWKVALIAPAEEKVIEAGVTIIPLHAPGQRLLRATIGAWRAYRAARRTQARVFQIHDPELLAIALLLKRRDNRVVYDMHESVRDHLLTKTWLGPRWVRRSFALVYGWFEILAVRKLDAVLLAVDTMKEDMVQRHPGEVAKFHVIRNLPVLRIIDEVQERIPLPSTPTLIYAGGISAGRGIKELIMALHLMGEVRLKLLGTWADQDLHRECQALPGWSKVDDAGQVRMDRVYDHLRAAHIGICILHPLPNHMLSRPIKAYEYMACRLPMIMSDFPIWRNEFSACASFADPMDPAAITAAVERMLSDRSAATSMGNAGRAVVEGEWCWEREATRLVDLYRQLLA